MMAMTTSNSIKVKPRRILFMSRTLHKKRRISQLVAPKAFKTVLRANPASQGRAGSAQLVFLFR